MIPERRHRSHHRGASSLAERPVPTRSKPLSVLDCRFVNPSGGVMPENTTMWAVVAPPSFHPRVMEAIPTVLDHYPTQKSQPRTHVPVELMQYVNDRPAIVRLLLNQPPIAAELVRASKNLTDRTHDSLVQLVDDIAADAVAKLLDQVVRKVASNLDDEMEIEAVARALYEYQELLEEDAEAAVDQAIQASEIRTEPSPNNDDTDSADDNPTVAQPGSTFGTETEGDDGHLPPGDDDLPCQQGGHPCCPDAYRSAAGYRHKCIPCDEEEPVETNTAVTVQPGTVAGGAAVIQIAVTAIKAATSAVPVPQGTVEVSVLDSGQQSIPTPPGLTLGEDGRAQLEVPVTVGTYSVTADYHPSSPRFLNSYGTTGFTA